MMELTPRSFPVDPERAAGSPRPGPSEAQKTADAAFAAARGAARKPLFRPPPPKPAPLPASDDVLDVRLAEEIDYIRRMLDAMGERLAADPILLQRHGQAMQGFDLIAQMLGHVASVVGTCNRDAAIERIMPDMRARLTRKSLFG
ncbi:hypothetical protein D1610_00035 [Sphingomonas gilva]|uniref:Uncharacterized protein n=1 Tax=Sphingomonas gilva TaxID=2305907 RepID=A0A396RRF9_9SPHN|nr:hypothetical protein [Sphingomonas gilva]RHW18606.1 hypothetical protein D1610_00035 [Sphingomonas gilva]